MDRMIGMIISTCTKMGFHDFELVKVLQKGMINEIEDPFYKKKVYIKQ